MYGEMVEWSITPVLKTGVLRGTGGSNPSLSAKLVDFFSEFYFFFIFFFQKFPFQYLSVFYYIRKVLTTL